MIRCFYRINSATVKSDQVRSVECLVGSVERGSLKFHLIDLITFGGCPATGSSHHPNEFTTKLPPGETVKEKVDRVVNQSDHP